LSVVVREMIRTRRDEMPRWEVSVDGCVVGWVRAHRIGRGFTTFYEAMGIDPEGDHIDLENSTDRDERVRIVVAFHEDPEPWRGIHWHPRSPREAPSRGRDAVGARQ
jgi:hypothetical protein